MMLSRRSLFSFLAAIPALPLAKKAAWPHPSVPERTFIARKDMLGPLSTAPGKVNWIEPQIGDLDVVRACVWTHDGWKPVIGRDDNFIFADGLEVVRT